MRNSFSPFTTLVVALFTIAAVSLSGCQNSFKMPTTPSWLSWSKKKPSSSLKAPDTNLPSPSATASPSQPRSYMQNRSTGSNYATTRGGSNYPSPTYGRPSTNPSYASTGARPDQGFYSSDYGKGTSREGTYRAPPARYASDSGSPGRSSYGTYGANGFTSSSRPPATGQRWANNDRGSLYGGASKAPAGEQDFGRTATTASVSDYGVTGGTYGQPGPASDYQRDSSGYGGASSNYPSSKGAASYSGNYQSGRVSASSANAAPAGQYRPGSTSRPTQYGGSQGVDVASLRDVQPASYGGSTGGASGADSVTNKSQAAPATYGSEGSRTATGQDYRSTSPIYR